MKAKLLLIKCYEISIILLIKLKLILQYNFENSIINKLKLICISSV